MAKAIPEIRSPCSAKLKEEDIRVFAIGVGTKEGELIQTSEGFVKDKAGNVVKSSLNEDMLERIAFETGGFYVRSAPGDFGLERVYRQGIAELQREERESRMSKIWTERFQWFVGRRPASARLGSSHSSG